MPTVETVVAMMELKRNHRKNNRYTQTLVHSTYSDKLYQQITNRLNEKERQQIDRKIRKLVQLRLRKMGL